MSNESLQRSVVPNNPVDPSIVRVLRTLDPIARDAGCAYFVAGATARDLILHAGRPHPFSAVSQAPTVPWNGLAVTLS